MNFLMLRSNSQAGVQEQQSTTQVEPNSASEQHTTLEGLIAEDEFSDETFSESCNSKADDYSGKNGRVAGSSGKTYQVDGHMDVREEDGSIIIPSKEIPHELTEAPDILACRSIDRSFVFPGEQIQILAYLSAYEQEETEIITPFKVAAAMNRNGIGGTPLKQNGRIEGETNPVSQADANSVHQNNQNGDMKMDRNIDSQKDVKSGESLLRLESHRRHTEQLLQRFSNSHFFVRIAESNESLWSKRTPQEENAKTLKKKNPLSAVIDRGGFDARISGGVARGAVKCCSLITGDIVVLLHVNVGVEVMKDPILEILQFEKYHERTTSLENEHVQTSFNQDPLLKWLLPLNNPLPPSAPPVSPPILSSRPSIRTTSTKTSVSGSSGSQFLSHFRSYSMSSLPPNLTTPQAITTPNARPSFEPQDWNQFSFRKSVRSGKEGLLSFRGVPLEPQRFSVQCGLEGIFTPGRRWRRKIELIQPVEIRSYSVDCNTDDLICVHVKNVTPANAPDVVVFIDSVTIVFEDESEGGPPLSLPISCTEAGNEFSLPDLALRRGEEHSFILKPETAFWRHPKSQTDSNLYPTSSPAGSPTPSQDPSSNDEVTHGDQYAVLVSCRCNYTESKLFFKQPTRWRPRTSRDLLISVASEMSRPTLRSDGTRLPVQVITLQASNMTSEDLTLTVVAPTSSTSSASSSSSSAVSVSNSPFSPSTPFTAAGESPEAVNSGREEASVYESPREEQYVEDGTESGSDEEQPVPVPELDTNRDLNCTHVYLQSRHPLGCVPSQSTAAIKLEVLPLKDGIITLDSIRISAKEKGLIYIPEQDLKINATTSFAALTK